MPENVIAYSTFWFDSGCGESYISAAKNEPIDAVLKRVHTASIYFLMNEKTAIELVEICHRLATQGFVTATDGNVSARLTDGGFLTTRTGVNKGMVTLSDLVEVDGNGKPRDPKLSPSTEFGMHLFIYHKRPDVAAVVHAHPIHATGFAAAGLALDRCIFPEVIVGLGAIPLASYATPSTPEVAESISPFVKTANAILLANHGVVTYGPDLWDAYFKMEKVEHAAHIEFVARLLGGQRPLTSDQLEKLRTISPESYGKDFTDKPQCRTEERSEERIPADDDILNLVRQMIRKSS